MLRFPNAIVLARLHHSHHDKLFSKSSSRRLVSMDLNFHQIPPVHHSKSPLAPVVIFHGLLGSASNFRLVSRFHSRLQLMPHRPIVLGDLRNHGASPHSENMSFEAMAADCVRLLDKIQADKCVLLGHSLGGKMAMATSLLHPDRIEQLVVADIAPVQYSKDKNLQWSSVSQVVNALASLDVTKIFSRADADKMLAETIHDKGLRQFVLQNLQPPSQNGQHWTMRCNIETLRKSMADFAVFPFQPAVHQFHGPSLFIAGSLSRYLIPDHHPDILSYFPQAEFDSVQDAGHWLHAEKPDQFFPKVAQFVNKHTASC